MFPRPPSWATSAHGLRFSCRLGCVDLIFRMYIIFPAVHFVRLSPTLPESGDPHRHLCPWQAVDTRRLWQAAVSRAPGTRCLGVSPASPWVWAAHPRAYLPGPRVRSRDLVSLLSFGWIPGSPVHRAWLFLAACQAVVFLERGVAWCPASVGTMRTPWQVPSGASAEVAAGSGAWREGPASRLLVLNHVDSICREKASSLSKPCCSLARLGISSDAEAGGAPGQGLLCWFPRPGLRPPLCDQA